MQDCVASAVHNLALGLAAKDRRDAALATAGEMIRRFEGAEAARRQCAAFARRLAGRATPFRGGAGGNVDPVQRDDHKAPLVEDYYQNRSIDVEASRSLDAVQAQCIVCSNKQGAQLSTLRVVRRKLFGF